MQQIDQWFYLKQSEQMGPVPYAEMIALKQRGELVDTSLVWTPTFEEWLPLGHCVDFSNDRMKSIFYEKKFAESFRARKNDRKSDQTLVLVHNDRRLSPGQTISLSSQGALIDVTDPNLLVGESIVLHFKKSALVPEPMNCKAFIVEKKLSERKRKKKDERTKYVVRFEDLVQDKISTVFFNQQTVQSEKGRRS